MNTISSKEVAEMLGKRHDNFMRDIRKYINTLGEDAPKYFVEGSYKDGLNKVRAGYDITLAGCELIAGRIIGEKSTAFKEKYLEAFGAPKKEWEAPVMDPVSTDLTVEEVAKRIGCSERNVYRMIKGGKLEAIQKEILVPTTKTFVTEEALEAYMADRGMA
jgi:Rha family phage regulatory protein